MQIQGGPSGVCETGLLSFPRGRAPGSQDLKHRMNKHCSPRAVAHLTLSVLLLPKGGPGKPLYHTKGDQDPPRCRYHPETVLLTGNFTQLITTKERAAWLILLI